MTENLRRDIKISAIMFCEDGFWVGQCLEFDISCQAKKPSEIPEKLMKSIMANIIICTELGKDLKDVPPAPKKFWEMFGESKIPLTINSIPMRSSTFIPNFISDMRLADEAVCA